MKLKLTFLSVIAMTLFALTSCSTEAKKIEGSWNIYSFTIDGTGQQLAPSEITFEKQSETLYSVKGNSGINSFFGDITVNGSKFTPNENFASTRMSGDPASMKYEDNFLKCLLGATKTSIYTENDTEFLEITNSKEKSVLVFVRK